ncbi:hypothetical protein [Mucilaginibacter sp.]|jgi:hypothetical protein|uniref:hypothetical protein n=1 Tax=Mucilaginibacter sp. TaxID=1882438 RepID=UPI0035664A7E
MKEIFESISKFGWAVIASCITFIVYVFLEKFKSRWSIFSFTRSFNSLATSINDNFYGSIKIFYNETRAVNHLNFITVNIKNESNTDFEDVNIKCWVDGDSNILTFNSNHDQYQTIIFMEDTFQVSKNEIVDKVENYNLSKQEGDIMPKDLEDSFNFFLRNVVWHIPVWNRKDSITFNLLVENLKGQVPLIRHPIEKKSIKLIEAESLESKNNRLGKWMLINGYIIYIIFTAMFLSNMSFDKSTVIAFAVLGGLYIWIGLFLYQLFQYTKSFFR